jgi:hypothetical protein
LRSHGGISCSPSWPFDVVDPQNCELAEPETCANRVADQVADVFVRSGEESFELPLGQVDVTWS